ncbi:MAG: hypothetical protein ACPLW7_05610 [Minisyncoccia bacterium]|jgi:hypothetical protein
MIKSLMFVLTILMFKISFAFSNDSVTNPLIVTTSVGRFDAPLLLVSPETTSEKMLEYVKKLREFKINGVILYEVAPNYGVLIDNREIWLHPRNKTLKATIPVDKDIYISKTKIKELVSLLHKNNIEAYYYDEMGANDEKGFNEKFAIYPPIVYPNNADYYSVPYFKKESDLNKFKGPITLYGEYGPAGNPYTMKLYYAKQIERLIKELNIDGIFLDSIGWKCELASFGRLYNGSSLNLTPDDICYDFIKSIQDTAKSLGKDNFKVFINMGFYKDKNLAYPKTLKIENVIWTIEIPNYHGWQNNKLYPKTYKELFNKLSKEKGSLIIYQPFFDTKNPYIYQILISIAVSNGLYMYHRGDYLGTAWALPLVPVVKEYDNFILRVKDFLYSERIFNESIKVSINPDLIYNYYISKGFLVINIININPRFFLTDNIIKLDKDKVSVVIEGLVKKNNKISILTPNKNEKIIISKNDYKKLILEIYNLDTWTTILIPYK